MINIQCETCFHSVCVHNKNRWMQVYAQAPHPLMVWYPCDVVWHRLRFGVGWGWAGEYSHIIKASLGGVALHRL